MKRVVRGVTKPKPKPKEPPKAATGASLAEKILRRQISIDPEGEVNIPIINEERLLRALDVATGRARMIGSGRRSRRIQRQDADFSEVERRALAAMANDDEVNIDVAAELARRFSTDTTVTGRIVRDTRRSTVLEEYGNAVYLAACSLRTARDVVFDPATEESQGNETPCWGALHMMVRILFPWAYERFTGLSCKAAILYTYRLAELSPPDSLHDERDNMSASTVDMYSERAMQALADSLNEDPREFVPQGL